MTDHHSRPHRAIDQFVFLITCGFLIPPFTAWLVLSSAAGEDQTAFTVFAPFVAAVVLVVLLLALEMMERIVAGSRPGWPPVLLGLPIACIASGLSFAAVYPGHNWWRDGLAGLAWGTAAATWGWRRWQQYLLAIAPTATTKLPPAEPRRRARQS
jgi:hypothetical protein